MCVFRLAAADIGRKKVVPVPVAAGGRVMRGQMAVTIHEQVNNEDGTRCDLLLKADPRGNQISVDPIFLLRCASTTMQAIDLQHSLVEFRGRE